MVKSFFDRVGGFAKKLWDSGGDVQGALGQEIMQQAMGAVQNAVGQVLNVAPGTQPENPKKAEQSKKKSAVKASTKAQQKKSGGVLGVLGTLGRGAGSFGQKMMGGVGGGIKALFGATFDTSILGHLTNVIWSNKSYLIKKGVLDYYLNRLALVGVPQSLIQHIKTYFDFLLLKYNGVIPDWAGSISSDQRDQYKKQQQRLKQEQQKSKNKLYEDFKTTYRSLRHLPDSAIEKKIRKMFPDLSKEQYKKLQGRYQFEKNTNKINKLKKNKQDALTKKRHEQNIKKMNQIEAQLKKTQQSPLFDHLNKLKDPHYKAAQKEEEVKAKVQKIQQDKPNTKSFYQKQMEAMERLKRMQSQYSQPKSKISNSKLQQTIQANAKQQQMKAKAIEAFEQQQSDWDD